MSDKTILTTGEVAEYCGVNFRTVIRWIDKGHLQSFKLPGARGDNRIHLHHFLAFLKENGIPIPREFKKDARKVLIVEDLPSMASAIQRVLKKQGFETQIANNGMMAGVYLGTFVPSVMTLDLSMPGMSGFEILTALKEVEGLSHLKILVISALPQADLERAVSMGADDFLSKPFDGKELAQKVRELSGLSLEV